MTVGRAIAFKSGYRDVIPNIMISHYYIMMS